MGRELRRKQAKREGKSLQKQNNVEKNELKKLIKIVLLLVFIICVIYILSALFVTKELNWLDKKGETQTENKVNDSILASSIFKQQEEEYYVYFYDFNEEKSDLTNEIMNKLYGKKVYKVDTSSALNSTYVSEKGNKGAKKLEDLKVVAPTLIKISNKKITKYLEKDEILKNLK